MSKPDKEQRRYACERINQRWNDAVKAYKEKHCLVKAEKHLTLAEKEALVFAGGVPFESGLASLYTSNVFDFSSYENENIYDMKKLDAFKKKTSPKAKRAVDAVMLGDTAEILDILTSFEKEMNHE